MAVEDKKISYRMYFVAFMFFMMAVFILIKLNNIQWVEGSYYRKLAKERTVKNFTIPANKGNVYSADGSLLATSIPEYTVYFDAVAPSSELFKDNLQALSDSLAVMLGKSSGYYQAKFQKARSNRNRYLFIARKLSYTEQMRIKSFPLFNKGANKGGLIIEQKIVREHPIGLVAKRTIGYERSNEDGKGLEYAFRDYLNGKNGHRMMQKIAKNQWKPINDVNEKEPQDGYDIISTIDVYIQDIAHHALLKQLEHYSADHGCVVVMETKTGHIKAISNLGRAEDGSYYETQNYAITESHEPGSTFKLIDLIAVLDDKKADTSTVYDSNNGVIEYYGRKVRDSKAGGYGKISLARGFELSSNTVLVKSVYDSYKSNPKQFVERINSYGLNKPLGLPIRGEGKPFIPQPGTDRWSGVSLPWMAFGYGLSVTPLQTLTFYNAVANNGVMVKPIFVSEIKEWNTTIKKFDTQVINPKICSQETLDKVKAVLENVIKRGTGSRLYSKDFSMAGKTGTAQVNYKDKSKLYYASSFVGYFPADEPKYSCIIVVHKPNVAAGYYGADVAGPVFKRIAQKIFTDSPSMNHVKNIDAKVVSQEKNYSEYYKKVEREEQIVPNVKGMDGMDAVALLENLGLKVKVKGIGRVKKQSLTSGQAFNKNQTIIIELS
ncbi:penicillin-binding protein [Flavobacterium cucumis]|uniref:Cell division protein FtsI (Penicillin-binding protein 3) n=1 Tax=Flavobacterium cucumis TaxID=416016 RepID=A0A1M7ZSU8_9FLAO|nr:penicillin-binding protein [Flavobacterium cucumis]SHO71964.1 cell division protein FtsI (penicillin-binding protein 3) [Flavobacterium cucumis]